MPRLDQFDGGFIPQGGDDPGQMDAGNAEYDLHTLSHEGCDQRLAAAHSNHENCFSGVLACRRICFVADCVQFETDRKTLRAVHVQRQNKRGGAATATPPLKGVRSEWS